MSTENDAARAPGGPQLQKALTGVAGFDAITRGGLPRGRATLVTGSAGAGKTLFGIEFLVHGATELGEPGVLLAFEETRDDLCENVASLGFDLAALERDGLLVVDAFVLDPGEIVETGAFDLEGLFLRLATAVDAVGAKRVLIDTIEVLFTAFSNEGVVRAEMARLVRWLRSRGLTAVITGERGKEGQLTRHGIEEYVSDCVVALDHRVLDDISTRRLRVLKYRGSLHGTNEYPFFIGARGLVVTPVTGVSLTTPASDDRISTGIERLDHMLSGGVFRGSTVLVSGDAGTGKTTIAAHAAAAACSRGERVVYATLEESPEQLVRNMASVGIDLRQPRDAGLLTIWASRPAATGLEEHLADLHQQLDAHDPHLMVLDAIGSLRSIGSPSAATSTVSRYIDMLKGRQVTAVLTELTHAPDERSGVSISSLVDTWVLLRNVEADGERNRLLFIIKSRGTAHSNQVREFVLTARGAQLVDVYVGPSGVLLGAARTQQLNRQEAMSRDRAIDESRRRQQFASRTAEVQAQVEALRRRLDVERDELERSLAAERAVHEADVRGRAQLGRERGADADSEQAAEVVDVR